MLLATIFEAKKPNGFDEKTREILWNFAEDQKTINELNLQDFLVSLGDKIKTSDARMQSLLSRTQRDRKTR